MTGTGIKGLIGLAATLAIAGAAPALAVPIDFEARADAYLKSAWPTDGPGAAVVVMDDGKIVLCSWTRAC
jgi:D-alanyl-D-alanine carboxypeptidase